MMLRLFPAAFMGAIALATGLACSAMAQAPGMGGPPSVGVIRLAKQPVTETNEFVGRIAAIDRVALVARVTAFLEQRNFVEGAEVKKGDLLYVLEQPPFQADLEAKKAAVQQAQAQLTNATLAYQRADQLLKTPAGQQSLVDAARATMLSDAASVLAAQAQEKVSEINLGYTEIRAPIDGKIGRTSVTIGNVVTPSSGVLTTIVSQDPMYVVFPIPFRTALDLRRRYADKGGFKSIVIRLRLPDGRIYDQTGSVDFIDNLVSPNTDSLIWRGTIPNPLISKTQLNGSTLRELVADEFVTVLLQGAEPEEMLAVPPAAVLSDQQGDYVFTVGAGNKVQEVRITTGQSTPTMETVLTGLSVGDMVIVDGIQKVRPGQVVVPGPASPIPGFSPGHTKAGGTAAVETGQSLAARQ
jgi:membrane fusion protein, multidrug efflux system